MPRLVGAQLDELGVQRRERGASRARPGAARDAPRSGRACAPPSASSAPAPRPRARRRRRRRRTRAAPPGTPAAIGKVASTIGTPPRRPAQARKPCSRSESPKSVVHRKHRERARDEHERDGDEDRRGPLVEHARRRHEQAEQHEQAELREPRRALQEAAHDGRVRDPRVADHEPDEVGGEQARAVQRRDAHGARERDGDGDHGREAGRGQRQAAQQPDAGDADGEPADRADAGLPDEQQQAVAAPKSLSCSTAPGRSRAAPRTGR